MSSLKNALTDMVDKAKTLSWQNNALNTQAVYAAIWNNQLQRLDDGESYPFNLPAVFIEAVMGAGGDVGFGIGGGDITFRIHLGFEQIDAGNGTMDQNLDVFDFRAAIINLFTHYEPTACSGLQCSTELLDFNHNNVYHYTIDFISHLIETSGSKYPTTQTTPPTDLTINAGYKVVEILGVAYNAGTLTVNYRVLKSQVIKFVLQTVQYSAGTQQPGSHSFNITGLSLSAGNYYLTALAVTDDFTSEGYLFVV